MPLKVVEKGLFVDNLTAVRAQKFRCLTFFIGHILQVDVKNNGLKIICVSQFNAAFATFGLTDLNILLFKHFAEGFGKDGIIVNNQNTRGKLP